MQQSVTKKRPKTTIMVINPPFTSSFHSSTAASEAVNRISIVVSGRIKPVVVDTGNNLNFLLSDLTKALMVSFRCKLVLRSYSCVHARGKHKPEIKAVGT